MNIVFIAFVNNYNFSLDGSIAALQPTVAVVILNDSGYRHAK